MSIGSIFSNILPGLSKAENFIVTMFSREDEVVETFKALAPATKAAMFATFYDAGKTLQAAVALEGAVASKNIPAAITLSETTLARVKAVVVDAEAAGGVFTKDLIALGLAVQGKTIAMQG